MTLVETQDSSVKKHVSLYNEITLPSAKNAKLLL